MFPSDELTGREISGTRFYSVIASNHFSGFEDLYFAMHLEMLEVDAGIDGKVEERTFDLACSYHINWLVKIGGSNYIDDLYIQRYLPGCAYSV